jgi:predicted lipid carrier protein YhbT
MQNEILWRLVPPPARLAAPLRLMPPVILQRATTRLIGIVLATPLAAGTLDALAGRAVAVEVTDLELRLVACIGDRRVDLQVPGHAADVTVRGSVTDLLLLASRLEDADTLFFHRRLQLVGDVELGLTVRNLLDQLPWEDVPLGLRIALNRSARWARAAREARLRSSSDEVSPSP